MESRTYCPLRSPKELSFRENMVADILSDAEHSSPKDGGQLGVTERKMYESRWEMNGLSKGTQRCTSTRGFPHGCVFHPTID